MKMGMLWYPGQDVDFMSRLERLERFAKQASSYQSKISDNTDNHPYTVDELEAENKELRMRVDDLEELVITLSEEMSRLSERISVPLTPAIKKDSRDCTLTNL
jgi:predicted RNase H-like nuclease (RuvC/YqgF family)